MDDERKSMYSLKRRLPVLIGFDYEHVMANAEIFREPDKILIEITSTGTESQLLGDFLEQVEPIALSFGGIPAQTSEKREKTN